LTGATETTGTTGTTGTTDTSTGNESGAGDESTNGTTPLQAAVAGAAEEPVASSGATSETTATEE
jgi:hypothetical protein